jgi:hypothetical protein
MRYLILLFIISSLTFSCTNEQIDTPVEGKKVVEEIKAGDRIRDIIRNPVSKDQEMDTTNLAKIVFKERRHY